MEKILGSYVNPGSFPDSRSLHGWIDVLSIFEFMTFLSLASILWLLEMDLSSIYFHIYIPS